MKKLFITIFSLIFGALAAATCAPKAHAQASCATTYTAACIGATVCYTVTGTSKFTIPQNLQRRYLLIQSQSNTDTTYFAICNASTCTATIGTNAIALQPPSSSQYPNYEVNALNATATPATRVPTGSIALISGATSDTVCVMEQNG